MCNLKQFGGFTRLIGLLTPHIYDRSTPLRSTTLNRNQTSKSDVILQAYNILLYLYLVFYMLYLRGADFLCAELTNKIDALFRRLKRFGYTTCDITVSDLIDTSGRDLFRKLCSSEHSLHHLLPPERKYSNLRNRGHHYELPEYCTNLHKKSYYPIIVFVHLFFTFMSCLLTVTLHLVDVCLTSLINVVK